VRFEGARVYIFAEMHYFKAHKERCVMPRAVMEDNPRMSLRIRPEQKALLARAAALRQTDLTTFVTRSALREAETVIEEAEAILLTAVNHGDEFADLIDD